MADQHMPDVDLAIIGGGCAGLSLAMRLARHPKGVPRTVIIEPRERYANDRTWAFWDDGPALEGLADMVARRWHRWQVSAGDMTAIHQSDRPYVAIASSRFYRVAREIIEGNDKVSLCLGTRAQTLITKNDHVEVETSSGLVRAAWVVDTRPPSFGQIGQAPLVQVFSGAEVKTECPVFDATTVGLMTDMSVDKDGFVFTYTLPYSPTHGLVEVTRFAADPLAMANLDDDLAAAIDRLPAAVTVGRRERGVLPMGLPLSPPAHRSSRIVHGGAGAGACRPATGYAFLRIQRWAVACADRIRAGGPPLAHPADPGWMRFMDLLFLRVIRHQPDLAPELFLALAQTVPPERFARFLSDEASPIDIARVISTLPPAPFLRMLFSIPMRQWFASKPEAA